MPILQTTAPQCNVHCTTTHKEFLFEEKFISEEKFLFEGSVKFVTDKEDAMENANFPTVYFP